MYLQRISQRGAHLPPGRPITDHYGDETSMHNLVLLCRRHHRLVHEGGFGIRRTASGEMNFSDPRGQAIPTAPEARSRGNVFSIADSGTAQPGV
jgi:hypothetical protein